MAVMVNEDGERGRNSNQISRDSGGTSSTRHDSASRKRASSRPRPQTEKSTANKAKDLSHVPCKFFKQGACAAGDECPFSHDTSSVGQVKPVCQWFQKGSCRFGHKCALAHILPGQPMSMDRKNKRAAQTALRDAQAAVAEATSPSPPDHVPPVPGPSSGIARTLDSTSKPTPGVMSYAERAAMASSARSQPPATTSTTTSTSTSRPTASPTMQHMVPPGMASRPQHALLQDQSRRMSNNSDNTRPSSLAIQGRAIPSSDLFGSSSPGPAAGSPAAIFGTSPFSGSRALFMPSSYDSNEDLFGRSPPSGSMMARVNSGSLHARFSPEDDPSIANGQHDDDEDSYEEGFLPSSLNDLLTPEEMQKRTAKAMLSQSVPMNMFWQDKMPHSMSPPSKSALAPAHSSLHAQILARHAGPSSFESRPMLSDMSTSPLGVQAAPGSLPPGLAAGLSHLHLEPARHTGETPPSVPSSFIQQHLSSSPGASRPANFWSGAPVSWGSTASASASDQPQQMGGSSPGLHPPSMLSRQQQQQQQQSSLGVAHPQQAMFARRVSSQTGPGFHTSSPLHHSVRSDEEEDEEEIQFEVEMS